MYKSFRLVSQLVSIDKTIQPARAACNRNVTDLSRRLFPKWKNMYKMGEYVRTKKIALHLLVNVIISEDAGKIGLDSFGTTSIFNLFRACLKLLNSTTFLY